MNKAFKVIVGVMVGILALGIFILGPEKDTTDKYDNPTEYVEYKMQTEHPDLEYDDIVLYNYRQIPNGGPSQLDYKVYSEGHVVLTGMIESGEIEGLYF